MSNNIFLSVGRTSTPEQEEFVSTIEKFLQTNGLIPRTVGRTYYKNQQPLKSIEECMGDCVGTIVIAFERIHINLGEEKRGSPEAIALNDVRLPTVWNQIEAAMSYSRNLPLLVFVENGLKNEGLLERGYDWYVKSVRLNREILSDPEFLGIFNDWKSTLENKADSPETEEKTNKIDADKLTIGEIISSLKPSHMWTIGISIVTILSAVATFAYKLGTLVSTPK